MGHNCIRIEDACDNKNTPINLSVTTCYRMNNEQDKKQAITMSHKDSKNK